MKKVNEQNKMFFSKDDVLKLFPVSRASWEAGVRSGKYPQPIRLSAIIVFWKAEDIYNLISKFNTSLGLLRLKDVITIMHVSYEAWVSGVKSGKYPKPIKIGARMIAWRVEDINNLINRMNADAVYKTTKPKEKNDKATKNKNGSENSLLIDFTSYVFLGSHKEKDIINTISKIATTHQDDLYFLCKLIVTYCDDPISNAKITNLQCKKNQINRNFDNFESALNVYSNHIAQNCPKVTSVVIIKELAKYLSYDIENKVIIYNVATSIINALKKTNSRFCLAELMFKKHS